MVTIENQIKCVERELKLRENTYKKGIESGKMKREQCAIEYRTMNAVLDTLKIAAGGAIGTFIKELSELDGEPAKMKKTLVVVMQENARLIAEIQEKQRLINVLNKFYEGNINEQINQNENSTQNS